VRRQLGEGTRFASERDGKPGLWLSFDIDDDEYWLRIPRGRVERQIALRWLGWGALALALSLLAAYFLVSRLSRPLRALAASAEEIGKGKTPEPVSESGPEEIRTLSRAFNQMSTDLARLDADRALILAGVSHDLRTPLSRLRLGLEMSGADPQLKDGMTADIEEMDRIINQFLDFARTDGGEAPQHADLSAIAAEVASTTGATGARWRPSSRASRGFPFRPWRCAESCSTSSTTRCATGRRTSVSRCAPTAPVWCSRSPTAVPAFPLPRSSA